MVRLISNVPLVGLLFFIIWFGVGKALELGAPCCAETKGLFHSRATVAESSQILARELIDVAQDEQNSSKSRFARLNADILGYGRGRPLDVRFLLLSAQLDAAAGRGDAAEQKVRLAYKVDPAQMATVISWLGLSQSVPGLTWNHQLLRPALLRGDWRIEEYSEFFGVLLRAPSGIAGVSSIITPQSQWLPEFFRVLMQDPRNLEALSGLLLSIRAKGINVSEGDLNALLNQLAREQKWDLAQHVHVLTSKESVVGYLNNGDFSKPLGGGPFNWHVSKGASHRVDVRKDRDGPNYLRIQFLRKPLRSLNLSNNFILPKGRYRLQMDLRSKGVGDNRENLVWWLICSSPSKLLESFATPQTSGDWVNRTLEFEHDGSCKSFRFFVRKEGADEGFRNRYSGTIDVRNVVIEKVS